MPNTAAAMVASRGGTATAIESGGRIIAWNEGAEELLGYGACEAVGDLCFTLLAGRDVFGYRYCSSHLSFAGYGSEDVIVLLEKGKE